LSVFALVGAIETGLVFALVALGSFLTFRLLDFPDLTVEGSFPLGAAVTAKCMVAGLDPWAATAAGAAAGAIAGTATAFLNLKLRILHILASILVAIALYSVNLRIMSGPNVGLLNVDTVYTLGEKVGLPSLYVPLIVVGIVVLAAKLLLDLFLETGYGLALRASGANPRMSRANGIHVELMICVGLAIANGLTGLAGGLFAQMLGAADVSMGIGVIVIALAAVIGGTAVLPSRVMMVLTLACVLGSIVYRIAIAFALNSDFVGLSASDVNLVTAILVAVALVAPGSRFKLFKGARAK
jgi:putative ABC transport system permease protein